MSHAAKLVVAGFLFLGGGVAMVALPARAQGQSDWQFLGRLSAKTNPKHPEVSVVHLTVTEPGSSWHGRDISISQCGSVSPQELAKRLGRIVRLHGRFTGNGAPTDGFCATQLDFSPAFGEMTNLPEITSAVGISADKSVIIGRGPVSASNPLNTGHAYKYSRGQSTDLGTLGGEQSLANGISGDGSVIVGSSVTKDSKGRAFRYSGGTMANLGSLGNWSTATGVSGDGKIIVGSTDVPDGSIHAFRYANGQMTDLGNMGGFNSYATAVSSNGLVIAGYIDIGFEHVHVPFTYTNGKVTRFREGGNAEPTALSADGSVVVGWYETSGRTGNGPVVKSRAAFVYSKGTAINWEWSFPQNFSMATGVSADGSVVVGYTDGPPFVYAGGSAIALLTKNADIPFPSSWRAHGVSSDGQAIVGEFLGNLSPPQPPRGFLFQ